MLLQKLNNQYEDDNGLKEDSQLISPLFEKYKYHWGDQEFVNELLAKTLQESPKAIRLFERRKDNLSPYGYWYFLGTLWVSYSGFYPLKNWIRLFKEKKDHREICIMKPYELEAFGKLPEKIIVYRAHRPDETEWISYTTSLLTAERFSRERKGIIQRYIIDKKDCIAFFLRRNEFELIRLP